MAVLKITKENFNEVTGRGLPVLIDFYADWCGPCRMMAPVMEEIAAERDDVLVGKINVDDEGELAMAFGVQSIPLIVLVRDGKVVAQSLGARPKASIEAMLEA